jgi:hypothetical protein
MSNYIKVLPAVSTPIGATLMKTGQTTSYRTGDDGDLERGRPTNFFTLPSNNPFGNTNRFTSELGTQTYTNNIVIDWSTYNGSTVLGCQNNLTLTNNITWDTAIDFCLTYSTGGFSGWRLGNFFEIANFMNFEQTTGAFNYVPFINILSGTAYWSSTTSKFATTSAITVRGNLYDAGATSKSGASGRAFPVRTFTVTGTTLT